MPQDRKRDGGTNQRNQRDLASPGDKNSWERTVDSVPSDAKDDPKTKEALRGDMSVRDGGPGKRPPRE
jgi:hypothetical protein